jgi:tRNA pseudouridine32 synthase / 23S rRNA pseudouridine746 synthase
MLVFQNAACLNVHLKILFKICSTPPYHFTMLGHAQDSQPLAITLVYADDSLVVINKPSGLLAVPGRGADKQHCASLLAQHMFADALIVHRLDQATSGLLLLARGPAMQRALGHLFEKRQVDKNYVSVVHGLVAPSQGSISLPLAADWPARPRQKVDHAMGKPALTRYQTISHDPLAGTTRLALQPETGRTHQLRVHMLAIGHPIVGDSLYADEGLAGHTDHGYAHLHLHAQSLSLVHPVTGEPMHWQCACPF